MTEHYMSATGVAEMLGVSPATIRTKVERGNFPAPDVMIGDTRGWSEATIIAYYEALPEGRRRVTRLVRGGE